MNFDSKLNSILHELSEARGILQSLSDDIWLNTEHNDNTVLSQTYEFKKEFNDFFSEFDKNTKTFVEIVKRADGLRTSTPTEGKGLVKATNPNEGHSAITEVGFYVNGHFFSAINSSDQKAINLLVNLFTELNKTDATFLQKFTDSDYNRGTSRTYVSQNKQSVTVKCEDGRIMEPKPLPSEYWLLNNLSNIQKMQLVKNLAAFTGQKYGKNGVYVLFKKKKM
jgi:hypothetical protein